MVESVLPVLLAFPPDKKRLSSRDYDANIRLFIKDVSKVSRSVWQQPVDDQNILELLDPTVNSIPYLFGLLHQLEASTKNRENQASLLTLAAIFLASFDPVQVRYVGEQWRLLFESLLKVYASSKATDVRPLVIALLRLDPLAGTFTINHLRLVRLCLHLGIPSQALPILDKNIFAFPPIPPKNGLDEVLCDEHELSNAYITSKSGFSVPIGPEAVLEYYLLGAHVYIGRRNFKRARLFLEYVLLSPSQQHSVSALQAEAYKRWLLIGLLADGKPFPLPRTADLSVVKNLIALARPYITLTEDFEKRDWPRLRADADTGAQIWAEDGNSRLVAEVVDALVRFRVVDLRKTFAALPISRVATHLRLAPDATFALLQEMIRLGHLNAAVTSAGPESILQFHAESSPADARANELEAQTQRITELVAFVRDADRRLQLTREYVEHQRRVKRGNGADADPADAMDLTWDAPGAQVMDEDDGDEDIMAG